MRAWLTRTVGRLALDALGSARARRELYVGPWLPEPLVDEPAEDPAEQAAVAESVALALLIVLERLSPAERTAFVLHDIFGMAFAEVADVLARSPAATRQLSARARANVAAGRPRFPPTRAEQRALIEEFARACTEGDLNGLMALLHPDVVWRTDGGGRAIASRRVQRGAAKVARGLVALARRPPQAGALRDVNGWPGLVLRDADGILTVISLTVDAGVVVAVDVCRNPEKLVGVTEP
jgi:RNA polymerase sigma-70 factor (ECF subfamily)